MDETRLSPGRSQSQGRGLARTFREGSDASEKKGLDTPDGVQVFLTAATPLSLYPVGGECASRRFTRLRWWAAAGVVVSAEEGGTDAAHSRGARHRGSGARAGGSNTAGSRGSRAGSGGPKPDQSGSDSQGGRERQGGCDRPGTPARGERRAHRSPRRGGPRRHSPPPG